MAEETNDSISIEDLFKAFGATPVDDSADEKTKKKSKKQDHSNDKSDMSEFDLLVALGVENAQDALASQSTNSKEESSAKQTTESCSNQLRSKQYRAEVRELENRRGEQRRFRRVGPTRAIRNYPSSVQKASFSSIFPKGSVGIIQPINPSQVEPSPSSQRETKETIEGFQHSEFTQTDPLQSEDKNALQSNQSRETLSQDQSIIQSDLPTNEQSNTNPSRLQNGFINSSIALQGTGAITGNVQNQANSQATGNIERIDNQNTGQLQNASHSGFMSTNFASSRIQPLNDSVSSFVPRDSQQFVNTNPTVQPQMQSGLANAVNMQSQVVGQPLPQSNAPTLQNPAIVGQSNFQKREFAGNPLPAFSNASFIQPLEPSSTPLSQPSVAGIDVSLNGAGTAPNGVGITLNAQPAITQGQLGYQANQGAPFDPQGTMSHNLNQAFGAQVPNQTGSMQVMEDYVAQANAIPQNIPASQSVAQTAQPLSQPVQPYAQQEQTKPLLPDGNAQLEWISSAPEPQVEPIKEDVKSSKRSAIIGISLISLALICVVAAFLLLSGIIDLSNVASTRASQSSSTSTTASQEGPLTDEAVYSYVVRGADGGTHEAIETAYFGTDGKLKQSILQIKVDNQDDVQALFDQLNSEFKDSVQASNIGDGEIVLTLNINRDDLDKDAYTELLSTNMAEFKVVQ